MTPASSYRIFAVLWVVSLLIWWQAIAATLALALRQDAYTHILLIFPVSIGLIIIEWNRRKWKPNSSISIGSALLGLAVLMGVAGLRWGRVDIAAGDISLSLEMLALVMWWIGSFVGCFGGCIFRGCIFPLFFLLWLVPIPEFALDYIVYLLQQGSASAAVLLFRIAGIPVSQDGTVVAIPGLTLEVAKECSSIRSSLMLVVTSMVMAHLLLRSIWGKALIALAAIPLSIAKNGVRIFILSVLGVYVDRGFLNGRLHHQGGILFFLLSLGSLFVLIWLVGWAEGKRARPALKKVASMAVGAGDQALIGS